jgi:hypothetical protein
MNIFCAKPQFRSCCIDTESTANGFMHSTLLSWTAEGMHSFPSEELQQHNLDCVFWCVFHTYHLRIPRDSQTGNISINICYFTLLFSHFSRLGFLSCRLPFFLCSLMESLTQSTEKMERNDERHSLSCEKNEKREEFCRSFETKGNTIRATKWRGTTEWEIPNESAKKPTVKYVFPVMTLISVEWVKGIQTLSWHMTFSSNEWEQETLWQQAKVEIRPLINTPSDEWGQRAKRVKERDSLRFHARPLSSRR